MLIALVSTMLDLSVVVGLLLLLVMRMVLGSRSMS